MPKGGMTSTVRTEGGVTYQAKQGGGVRSIAELRVGVTSMVELGGRVMFKVELAGVMTFEMDSGGRVTTNVMQELDAKSVRIRLLSGVRGWRGQELNVAQGHKVQFMVRSLSVK